MRLPFVLSLVLAAVGASAFSPEGYPSLGKRSRMRRDPSTCSTALDYQLVYRSGPGLASVTTDTAGHLFASGAFGSTETFSIVASGGEFVSNTTGTAAHVDSSSSSSEVSFAQPEIPESYLSCSLESSSELTCANNGTTLLFCTDASGQGPISTSTSACEDSQIQIHIYASLSAPAPSGSGC